jgi:hypothetical protein
VSRPGFDFLEACDLIVATPPERLDEVVGDDPRLRALADHLLAGVAQAPPITVEQRAVVRSVFRGGARRG